MDPKNNLPVPDPSSLTTEQLDKGLLCLREILEARLDAVDKLLEHQQDFLNQRQEAIDAGINHLKSLQDEKFHSIATQFSERDTRTEQTSRDSKVAVDAALQAAKEAVGEQNKSSALAIAKSEAATTKQIDQIAALINTTVGALHDKINDIKGRLDRGEGGVHGVKVATDESKAWLAIAVAVMAVVVSLVARFIP